MSAHPAVSLSISTDPEGFIYMNDVLVGRAQPEGGPCDEYWEGEVYHGEHLDNSTEELDRTYNDHQEAVLAVAARYRRVEADPTAAAW